MQQTPRWVSETEITLKPKQLSVHAVCYNRGEKNILYFTGEELIQHFGKKNEGKPLYFRSHKIEKMRVLI